MVDQSPVDSSITAAGNGGPQPPAPNPSPEPAPASTETAAKPAETPAVNEANKDQAAIHLADAIRELIRAELKDQPGAGKKPRPKTGWDTFWSVVMLADFLLVATLLIETTLEGANLKLFLDVLPVLSGLLVFLLPQIREQVDTISQELSFRIASLILLGPLLLSAFPVLRVPASVLPAGTQLTINGRSQAYDEGAVRLRLWPSYTVKLASSDAAADPREYHLTLKQALRHWYADTNVEWELWYEVVLVSEASDINVRIERQGEFPPEFLERAKANGYTREGKSSSALNTSFLDNGATGNRRKVRLLPLGTYRFTASKDRLKPFSTQWIEITPSNREVSFADLIPIEKPSK